MVWPYNLAQAVAYVPDTRHDGSVRYPLQAMLALAVSSLLASHHSVLAMAEWGARPYPVQVRHLGLPDGVTPRQSTFQRLFCRLDGARLGGCQAAWFQRVSAPDDEQAIQGVTIDGKSQRSRLVIAADGPVHVLSAFCPKTSIVLVQPPITETTAKTEAELTITPRLLEQWTCMGGS